VIAKSAIYNKSMAMGTF